MCKNFLQGLHVMARNLISLLFQTAQQCIANCLTNFPTLDELVSSCIGWIQLKRVSIFRILATFSSHYAHIGAG